MSDPRLSSLESFFPGIQRLSFIAAVAEVHSHSQCGEVPFPPGSSRIYCLLALDDGYSYRWDLISHHFDWLSCNWATDHPVLWWFCLFSVLKVLKENVAGAVGFLKVTCVGFGFCIYFCYPPRTFPEGSCHQALPKPCRIGGASEHHLSHCR